MKFNFKNKHIIVTGCNGNLGKQIVKKFISLEAKVTGLDLYDKSIINST